MDTHTHTRNELQASIDKLFCSAGVISQMLRPQTDQIGTLGTSLDLNPYNYKPHLVEGNPPLSFCICCRSPSTPAESGEDVRLRNRRWSNLVCSDFSYSGVPTIARDLYAPIAIPIAIRLERWFVQSESVLLNPSTEEHMRDAQALQDLRVHGVVARAQKEMGKKLGGHRA